MNKILITLMFFIPIIGFAQNNYVPLEPLPGTTIGVCDPSQANWQTDPSCQTNVSTFVPNIFILLIAIAGGLAVVTIVVGGFQYLSTDAISGKKEGKQKITNALVGLLLAIASYIILNTLNPQILQFNLAIRGVPSSPTTPPPTVPPGPTPTPPTSGTCNLSGVSCTGSSCYSYCPAGSAWPDDTGWRQPLIGSGNIVITSTTGNTSNCKLTKDPGCTSVYNLGPRAMTGLLSLSKSCKNCKIVITGGTEFWPHVSHGPGNNKVDIDDQNSALNNYIRSGTSLGNQNGCINGYPAWKIGTAVYVYENRNHWHVCY